MSKKEKRKFKPKVKAAKIKDEVAEEAEAHITLTQTQEPTHKKKQKDRKPPQRNLVQTAGTIGVVENGSGWGTRRHGSSGGGGGGGGGGSSYQLKAPLVKQEKKLWTKEERKKEEIETKEVLSRIVDENFIIHDPALVSEPDYDPISVGVKKKEIEAARRELLELADNEDVFIEALHDGNSDKIFLLQLSDLPVVPQMASLDEDDYDPNEEQFLGEVLVDSFSRTASMEVGHVKMAFTSGSASSFVQEVARITSSSFQVVGEVTQKLTLTPDVEGLLSNADHS